MDQTTKQRNIIDALEIAVMYGDKRPVNYQILAAEIKGTVLQAHELHAEYMTYKDETKGKGMVREFVKSGLSEVLFTIRNCQKGERYEFRYNSK